MGIDFLPYDYVGWNDLEALKIYAILLIFFS